jgi:hypothetical protein
MLLMRGKQGAPPRLEWWITGKMGKWVSGDWRVGSKAYSFGHETKNGYYLLITPPLHNSTFPLFHDHGITGNLK